MVKLEPRSSQFDPLEPGVYVAQIDSVTAEDANPQYEDSRPQLKFVFRIPGAEDGDEDRLVFDWTGQTYGKKSKLRPWLSTLLPDFDPDEDTLETDVLIGKACRLMLTVKPSGYNRVAEVLPLKPRKSMGSDAPEPTSRPAAREPVPTVAQRRVAVATAPTLDPDDVPF